MGHGSTCGVVSGVDVQYLTVVVSVAETEGKEFMIVTKKGIKPSICESGVPSTLVRDTVLLNKRMIDHGHLMIMDI